jgi:hypothetical protein
MRKLVLTAVLAASLFSCQKEDIDSYQSNQTKHNNIPTTYGYFIADTSKPDTFVYNNVIVGHKLKYYYYYTGDTTKTLHNDSVAVETTSSVTIIRTTCFTGPANRTKTINYNIIMSDILFSVWPIEMSIYTDRQGPYPIKVDYIDKTSFQISDKITDNTTILFVKKS